MSNEICVLAYSGGLDTSALVPYMKEKYGYDIVALLVDVGHMKDVEGLRQRGLTAGAVESIVVDAKEEFLTGYAFEALKANALYENKYPLHSALSRPLIAKKMVEAAHQYGAKVVAHGCTAKGNDQVRIDVSVRCLDPSIKVLGPAREWGMTRPQIMDYLAERGIELPLTKKNPYSIDENLWGRAIECGELEDPWTPAPNDAYAFTVDPQEAPDEPVEVIIGFEAGLPVSLDGEKMGPVELVEKIDMIAGATGFGRIDMVENRRVGIKSREVYEAAGPLVAHQGPRRTGGPHLHAGTAALQVLHRPAHDGTDLRRSVVQPARPTACAPSSTRASSTSPAMCACATTKAPAASSVGARPTRSMWTPWPPTAQETRSATSPLWASSSFGAFRWKSMRVGIRACSRCSLMRTRRPPRARPAAQTVSPAPARLRRPAPVSRGAVVSRPTRRPCSND